MLIRFEPDLETLHLISECSPLFRINQSINQSLDLKHNRHQHYLNDDPPAGLHRHRDEGDDGVCDGEVEHQVVNICTALQILSGGYSSTNLNPNTNSRSMLVCDVEMFKMG